jgi:hypothetical protein
MWRAGDRWSIASTVVPWLAAAEEPHAAGKRRQEAAGSETMRTRVGQGWDGAEMREERWGRRVEGDRGGGVSCACRIEREGRQAVQTRGDGLRRMCGMRQSAQAAGRHLLLWRSIMFLNFNAHALMCVICAVDQLHVLCVN